RRRRGIGAEGRGDAARQTGGGQVHAAGEAVLRRDGDRARAVAPLGDGHAARRGRQGVGRRDLGIHGEGERGRLRRQGARGAREGDGDRARGSRGVGRQRQRARRRRGVRAEGRGDADRQPGGRQGDRKGVVEGKSDGDGGRGGAPIGDGQDARRGRQGLVRLGRSR